jgi:N utilization substance protein B
MPAYADELISLVRDHQADLQPAISQQLKKGWTWERLSQIDRAILLLAVAEIKYSQQISAVGAVDEALNLCDEFGDPKSKRFINGVLAKFVD